MTPLPVFPAIGEGALGAVERLALDPHLRLVATPRAARVLLVAGAQRPADRLALASVHDQLPAPRRTLWWRSDPLPGLDAGRRLPDDLDAAAATLTAGLGEDDEPAILDDRPPNPWEGIGPHGQGGEGMMGGTPYGRPMPMTADDLRDGLALDPYSAMFGPYLAAFPPGLSLRITLQGDVIQSATPMSAPYTQDGFAATPHCALARVLRLMELPALAERLVRAAAADPDAPRPRLARAVRWSGLLAAIPPGLGAVGGRDVRGRVRGLIDALTKGTRRDDDAVPDLAGLLPGLEWQEAVLCLVSFDLARLREAAVPPAAAHGGRAAA
ncbi:hypothetical protein DLJ53_33120 [Acuticoccus sediminis]|uniref:Uncharacterized protein n=1 Tax=Acuticoccus sediminis TaxID=2184697 RepID=A0A8B2NGH8_9HYPH|nr:hypothetical protein DLJ53_33120 [Acuticoccus sediminis]